MVFNLLLRSILPAADSNLYPYYYTVYFRLHKDFLPVDLNAPACTVLFYLITVVLIEVDAAGFAIKWICISIGISTFVHVEEFKSNEDQKQARASNIYTVHRQGHVA